MQPFAISCLVGRLDRIRFEELMMVVTIPSPARVFVWQIFVAARGQRCSTQAHPPHSGQIVAEFALVVPWPVLEAPLDTVSIQEKCVCV